MLVGASELNGATTMEIIAHRGASYDAPENTLAAVRLAWRQNADAVEVDVFLTQDGHIVAFHDENTNRLTGRDKKVADQTLAELKQLDVSRWKGENWTGERIPTLAEVLAIVGQDKRVLIEVKCGRQIVPKLQDVLAKSGLEPWQPAVIGSSLETMAEVKRAIPRHRVYWVVGFEEDPQTGRWSPQAEELIRQAKAAALDGLDLGIAPLVDRSFITQVKQAGLQLFVWTVNSPEEARRLQAAGADGVVTDRPGWLRDRLRAVEN